MKLKIATVTFDFVMVVDDNESEKESIIKAQWHIQDVLNDMSKRDINVELIDYLEGNLEGWGNEDIPYAGDNVTPIKKYLSKGLT